jgi:CDP-glycerol glycerophosphotransferase (TagB/SpsB family)
MRRYLFYVSQVYSLAILRPLQKLILERGDAAAWFFDSPNAGAAHLLPGERSLASVADVKAFNPQAVFVPGNIVPDFFPGLKVEVFHGLANDDTGKPGHYRIRGFFDLYCTHAPEGTRNFQALAEKHPHFKVVETGWPKVDPLFATDDDTTDLRRELGIIKPIVFYASTFSPSLTSAPAIVEEIARLSRSGRWHWLLTLHPKMPAEVVDRYRRLAGPDLTFFESSQDVVPLLRAGDIMLCDTSSIALEFMLLDKPVVTFRTRVPGPQVLDVRDTGELEAALGKALTRPAEQMAAMRTFIDRLHPYRDGRSAERVLAATDDLIESGAAGLLPKPFNLVRRMKIRRQLGYYRWR